ncbi:MAG: metallophosphatase family protein [Myxococcota bacterium]|jgi:hypothetical protein|nr:metallophosphatase family protein [Myxococcota bacterium]
MKPSPAPFVGVVSDTHGELPPAVIGALRGASHIVHAGDAEHEGGIAGLRELAPVCAVRGNMDRFGHAGKRPISALVEFENTSIYVLHDLSTLDLDPAAAGIRVVIHGHTHVAEVWEREGVLYLNPGSAVRPRAGGPTVARLHVMDGSLLAELVPL